MSNKHLTMFAGLRGGFQSEQMRLAKQARGKSIRLTEFWTQPFDTSKPSLYSPMIESLSQLLTGRVNYAAWDMSFRELQVLAARAGHKVDAYGLWYLITQLKTENLLVTVYVDKRLPKRTAPDLPEYWSASLMHQQEDEDYDMLDALGDHFDMTAQTLSNSTVIDFTELTVIAY